MNRFDIAAALLLALVGFALAWRRLPGQAALALPPLLLGLAPALDLAQAWLLLDGLSEPRRWAWSAALGGALPLLALQVGWPEHGGGRELPAAVALVVVGAMLAALPDHGWWGQLLAALAGLALAVRAPAVCRSWGSAGALALWAGLLAEALGWPRWLVPDAAQLYQLGLAAALLCLQRCLPPPAHRRRPR